MSSAVEAIIDAFDRLTVEERREAIDEILRRAQLADHSLDDETIDRIADGSFLEYDAREAVDFELRTARNPKV